LGPPHSGRLNPRKLAAMQELTGRLQALDPEASESLKVISYFDVLINGKVSVEALLRAAVTLTGCPCGYSPVSGKPIRLCPNGERTAQAFPAQQGGLAFTMDDGGRIWLERVPSMPTMH